MGRPKKWRIQSAARARASKKVLGHPNETTSSSDTEIIDEMPAYDLTGGEETTWTGGVNHKMASNNNDFSWEEDSSPSEMDSDDDDSDLVQRLEKSFEHELRLLTVEPSAFEELMKARDLSKAEWRKAERNRAFGYTRNSDRSARRRDKAARDKEVKDVKLRET
jgi:hypothetical protein